MNNTITWIKSNKPLSLVLALIIGYLVYSYIDDNYYLPMSNFTTVGSKMGSMEMAYDSYAPSSAGGTLSVMGRGAMPPVIREESVSLEPTDRKVVTDTNLSMLVADVNDTIASVRKATDERGGFVVNSYSYQPTESASGSIAVRIPNDQLESFMDTVRGLAIRVTSENITGYDVTDAYTDHQARLATLEATLSKFQAIFDRATEIPDTLEVQRAIIQVQEQIDQVKGRLAYLEGTTSTSLVTISMSTDELALPYAPDNAWRPEVIFKQAVRSLVTNARSFGSLMIWMAVYSPVLLAVGGGVYLFRKVRKTRSQV